MNAPQKFLEKMKDYYANKEKIVPNQLRERIGSHF